MMRRIAVIVTAIITTVTVLGLGTPARAQTDEPTAEPTLPPTEEPTAESTVEATPTETATPTLALAWQTTLTSGQPVELVYSMTVGDIAVFLVGVMGLILLMFLTFLTLIKRR